MLRHACGLVVATLVLISTSTSTQSRPPAPGPPYSPQDALGTIRLAEGFRVELFASEPLITSPVAMEVDERGRLFVVEMPGYPLDASGSGRVVMLDDTDGDGRPDRRSVFAEGLKLPAGIMAWKRGVLVTDSPQVYYLEDTDSDGRADVKRELLTGFALSNPQHTTNTPLYGLDNWIYLANEGPVRTIRYRDIFGDAGGEVRFPDRPDSPRLPPDADGRNVRFRPDTYELEMLSARSQFGQTFDAWGHHFNVSNSRPIYHEVLPARYLARNPALVIPSAIEQVPDYRQPAEVFPITENPEYQLLTDVGVITSASGLTYYLADLFPEAYRHAVFVAEGAHNMVHAATVRDHGVTFRASRMFDGREFMASTDSWFRPVNFYLGPDGALYVIDYYRKILEHPEWLDDATAKSADLTAGRDRGRIYRVVPEARSSSVPAAAPPRNFAFVNPATPWINRIPLGNSAPDELVRTLAHPNIWWRRHAQRLLVGTKPAAAIVPLVRMTTSGPAVGRVHALWTLEGMRQLTAAVIARTLLDPTPGVRENAIKLAELHLQRVPTLARSLLRLSRDPDPKVRFQLLLSLGSVDTAEAAATRQRMLIDNVEDDWMQLAGLSALNSDTRALFALARERLGGHETPGRRMFFGRIAATAAGSARPDELREVLRAVALPTAADWWRAAALGGLATGFKADRRNSADLEPARSQVLDLFRNTRTGPVRRAALQLIASIGVPRSATLADSIREAEATADNQKLDGEARADAIRFLAVADAAAHVKLFTDILGRAEPTQVHLAALRAIAEPAGDAAARTFVSLWDRWTPAVRDEAIGLAVRDHGRLKILLDALDAGTIRPSEIAWPTQMGMMMSDDETLRARARGHLSPRGRDQAASIAAYREALSMRGDVDRGRAVFARVCSACHQYRGQLGIAFGPDLGEARSHLPGSLVADILRPSQSIADGYELWIVQLNDGSSVAGTMASETPTSVTIRRPGGQVTPIGRTQIVSMKVADVSAMPEGLETQIDVPQMADLIAFIRGSR